MDGKILNLSKIKICFYLRRKHIFLTITPKFFRQCVQVDRSCRVRDFKFARKKTVCLALISTLSTSHESATWVDISVKFHCKFLNSPWSKYGCSCICLGHFSERHRLCSLVWLSSESFIVLILRSFHIERVWKIIWTKEHY